MNKNCIYIIALLLFVSCKTTTKVDDVTSSSNLLQPDSVIVFPTEQINIFVDSLLHNEYKAMASVYQYHQNKALWLNDSNITTAIQWLKNAGNHGLDTTQLSINELLVFQKELAIRDSNFAYQRAIFDLQLTHKVQKLGYQIRYSNLKPTDFYATWNFDAPKTISDSVWINLIANNKADQLNAFFSPKHKLYQQLSQQLEWLNHQHDSVFQKIINPGFSLRKGDSNQYVVPLRLRLLPADSLHKMVFDDDLHHAVINFQKQHGLYADGIVGAKTYYFLNLSKKEQQNMIKMNLEKLRWLSDYQLQSGIVVNIPTMELTLYQTDSLVFQTEVIVGKYKNQTPVFHSNLDYVVFNPCWTVPNSIASKKMLPRLQKDSTYLQNRNMFITQNGKEINPCDIDFSKYNTNYFPFKIFQRTSSSNALGAVKFMFDNKYSIYLHDTPGKSLFQKSNRALSHGCVRVNRATTMAERILHDIDGQTTPHQYYYKKGYPIKVYLKKPISLSIVYFNYWYDNKTKQLVYNSDIYHKDRKLLETIANRN